VAFEDLDPEEEFTLEHALQHTAYGLRVAAKSDGELTLLDLEGHGIYCTLAKRLQLTRAFFGGSALRETWGAPHCEYDLFVVLDDAHRHYQARSPTVIFADIAAALRHQHSFRQQKHSGRIAINYGHGPAERRRPASIIVLPAFAAERGVVVPDRWRDAWITVDPGRYHAMAKQADRKRSNWRELVRIVKAWNNRDLKFEPYVKPGLLLEVMAMDIVDPQFGSDLGTQLVALFQMLYRRFDEDWPDPAGLGPPLTSYMTPNRRAYARDHLEAAWLTLGQAKRADNGGNHREAMHLARSVLGRRLPTSWPKDDVAGLPINRFEQKD
jgi:hypothetical protein